MRFATTLAAALACACHAAAQTPPPASPVLAGELRAVTAAYSELRAIDDLSDSASFPSANARRLLADPRKALGVLEKQFYLQPAIESLAWFGTVAEDVAHLNTHPRGPLERIANSEAPRAWLPAARSAWRRMTDVVEQGWQPGAPWARFGNYRYGAATPNNKNDYQGGIEHALARWFTAVKPSFWREDTEIYATGGEPVTKRFRLRGAKASVTSYVAEISSQVMPDEHAEPPSSAGAFRRAWPLLEFLKGQGASPTMRFTHTRRHDNEGLLGTVGVQIQVPTDSPLVWVLSRQGVTPARSMQLTATHVPCGSNEGIRVALDAPLKTPPLAYVASLRAIPDLSLVKVTALGTVKVKSSRHDTEPDFQYTGWRFDLDGDGQPDVLLAQGRGPSNSASSGNYDPKDFASLDSFVWANIGGIWKRVAHAYEGVCT